MKVGAEPPTFSRPIDVRTVPDGGLEISIEATSMECAAIAEEIGVPRIDVLKASFSVAKRSGRRFHVHGAVQARLTQICVVTLEPFDGDIAVPIDLAFASLLRTETPYGGSFASKRRSRRTEAQESTPILPQSSENDPPDPIIDDRIDLGAVTVEFLTLALDFYPRKPGVQFSDVVVDDTRPTRSAFAALERLKDRS